MGRTAQIGSTPQLSRCWSMKVTITSFGGRAPPRRKTPPPSLKSRWRVSVRTLRGGAALIPRAHQWSAPAVHRGSRSAWRTQRLNASVEMPSLSPTDRIAAHCDGCSGAWSRTIRTARSRTSGECLLGRPMGPILSRNGPSDKPGTIQRRRAHFKTGRRLPSRSPPPGRPRLKSPPVRLLTVQGALDTG